MPYAHFFLRNNIFSARLVFRPSRTAKKAAKRTRVGFRTCGSALATLLPPSTPDRAAGSEVPGSAGVLVRFGAHSPPTLTHQETGPAKSVSKQHHICTAPV